VVAKRAGKFAGGFLNNPGALAAIGIVVSIITTLVIFRNDIRNFLGTTIPEAFGDINIQLPSIELPSIELPSFELPSFELPSFPTFEFPTLPSFEDIFPPGDNGDGGDFTDVGMAAARARQDSAGVTPPREDIPELVSATRPLFDIIEETQAEFQERAGFFVEALPEVTAFTSLPGSVTDFVRRQLSRESEDFESVLAAEARRSETIFAGLFGNVQNPEFGA